LRCAGSQYRWRHLLLICWHACADGRASTELTRRFANAAGIGFVLGSKTGFAVADVDNKIPGMARRVPEFRRERLPFVRIRGARQ
jgi:hypothetical protein